MAVRRVCSLRVNVNCFHVVVAYRETDIHRCIDTHVQTNTHKIRVVKVVD